MSITHLGQLDRRITLQRGTLNSNNAFNEPILQWSNTATVWAKRMDASASESYRAREVGAEITTRFTIRYSTAVANTNPKDRLFFEGRGYNITAVRYIGRNQWLEIDAVVRPDRG